MYSLSIFFIAFRISFARWCNSLGLSIVGAGAIANQERFPAAHFGRGGSFLGRESTACVIIEGLKDPDLALDTSIAHFHISADTTSMRVGLKKTCDRLLLAEHLEWGRRFLFLLVLLAVIIFFN